jgi:hypothetical protein
MIRVFFSVTHHYLGIEVEGVVEDAKRSYYSVSLYVENNKVAKSKKSKSQSSAVKWEWETNNQV